MKNNEVGEKNVPAKVATDYGRVINDRFGHIYEVMSHRSSPEDLARIKDAFELARKAHASQLRKGGEPYILHPIAVATIIAEDLQMDANMVIAAFLHDVVEDTEYTIEDIRNRFGDDVAFLVGVVTKKQGHSYEMSKQLDNYRQILASVQYDVRAVLIKLADRLHNMRTLKSMKPEKQMKIAGETDYFYAPLANRLGLYEIKTELENLSFRFRCPEEYEELSSRLARHVAANRENLETFRRQIAETLEAAGIKAHVTVDFRSPFSLWRKMHKYGDDFNHLKYRHFIDVVFDKPAEGLSEKEMAMRIYCVLTDRFKEKHGGMTNYIDSPKENGYQSLHVKLLPDFGRWQEVHISSKRMEMQSRLGCVSECGEGENVKKWIDKFRVVLREAIDNPERKEHYLEDVVSNFYNDDIQVFTPEGEKVILPQNSTVLDYAYEVDENMGNHAKYARITGFLYPVTYPLRRGDVVEVFTTPDSHPEPDWRDYVHTYKAKRALRHYFDSLPKPAYIRCEHCHPIPGEEVIGIRNHHNPTEITVHKRDCRTAISLASSYGDDVVEVKYEPDETLYPVTLSVKAVDRHHLLIDLVDCITNTLNLSMQSFNTKTERHIVEIKIQLGVHSNAELRTIIDHISKIDAVDEVKRICE